MDASEAEEVPDEEFLKCLEELLKLKEANEKYLHDLHESQRKELSDEKLRFLNSLWTSDESSGSILPNDLHENISKESEFVCTPNSLLITPNTLCGTEEDLNNSIESKINRLMTGRLNDQAFPEVDTEIMIDEVPIVPKYNDFNALLETELRNETNENINETPKIAPKKYLKKGEGLARFKMTRHDIGQTNVKMPWLKTKPVCSKTTNVKMNDPKVPAKSKKQLDFRLDNPVVKNIDCVPENKICTETFDEENESENDRIYTSDTSISMSPSVSKSAMKKELAEQRMFDLIEKKVENMSFSSTNSFFAKVLGPSYSTEIGKQLLGLIPCPSLDPSLEKQISGMSENIDEGNKSDSKSVANGDETESSDSEDTTVSSISEETCRIANNAISTSTPNQNNAASFEKKVHFSNPKNIDVAKKNIVITLINSDDTTLTESGSESRTLTEICTDEESEPMDDNAFQIMSNKFELRIKELEKLLNIVRNDNVQLKNELEMKKKELFEEKANFETKLNEEKVIAEYYLAEEREKLEKNKSLYDRHIREMKSLLSRKEKERHTLLDKDYEELKEKFEAKNAKCSSLHAKLRNQIKSLETENKALKEECEKLKKENRKLKGANARTQKLSNIKLLADINKSLTTKSIENFECHKGISTDSVNSLDPKKFENVHQKTTKPNSRARTKSAPNLNITSRYAKFFSEKDSANELKNGFGLQSDEESDPDIEFDRETSIITFPQISQNRMSDEYLQPDLSKNTKDRSSEGIYTKLHSRLSNDEPRERIDAPTPRTPLTEMQNLNIRETNEDLGVDRTVKSDGSTEIKFSNGNRKILSADGSYSKFFFYNGDVKEVFYQDGIVKYYFKEPNIRQTTYKDGSEVLHFPDGYIEKRDPDGTVQSHLPDGTVKWIKPGNVEECRFPDGTLVSVNSIGEQTIRFPNGQVEIHTSEFMKREFPDGTVKIVYADGSTETIFASGRIRTKDKAGNLIMDTANRISDQTMT